MPHWLLAGIGGFVGSASRYALSGAAHRVLPAGFPWGTLVVNVVGCFAIGVLGSLSEERGLLTADTRVFLMIGVLGGFTTFSSFGFETLQLLRDGQLATAFGNVVLQLFLGLAAAWAGFSIAR